MRLFKLINALGQEFDLMREDAFFQNPDGLGMARELDFIPAGSEWIKTNETLSQPQPSGEMVFAGYEQYSEFVKFCSYPPLKFCYCPSNKTWFFLDCELASVGKTEVDFDSGRLICPVDFSSLGLWYRNALAIKSTEKSQDLKSYPYRYLYKYAEGVAGTVKIRNKGNLPSPCRFRIYGPCKTPSWKLTQSGVVISTGRINTFVQEGHALILDSSPDKMEIGIYTADTLELLFDAYEKSDFSTPRFVYIPPGESFLTFSQSGTGKISSIVEVKQLASTV